MKEYRIVIGGCRDYRDYPAFCHYVDHCLGNIKSNSLVIISGHCSGVDAMAERYAKERGYRLEVYPAEWEKFEKSAGPRRNKLMVERADYVIAFWDQKSRGTKSLISFAKEAGKPLWVKIIEKQTEG